MDYPIEYVRSAAMTSTMLTPMHGTECKGIGKILGLVVGIAASIAVPFLAPYIGAALNGGFFASIAGQALIGAGIGALGGAASAGISGSDILKGALIGGAAGALTGGGGAFLRGAGLTTAAAPAVSPGFVITQAGGEGLSTGLITGVDPVTGLSLASGSLGNAAATPLATTSEASTGTASTALAGSSPGAASTLSAGFKNAAVQSLIAGGTQMLQALMPSQQADLFAQMQREMEVTRTQDAAAYAAQKKIFDDYYNFAKGIHPEFYAQLERNNAQQRLSTTWADTERSLRERGVNDVGIASERRRHEVQGTAGLNTASTAGYLRGLDAQGAAYRTASGLYPSTPTGYSKDLRAMYDLAGVRESDQAAGIAGLVEPWKVYAQERAQSARPTI